MNKQLFCTIHFFFTSIFSFLSVKHLSPKLYVKPSTKNFFLLNLKIRKIIQSKKGIKNYKMIPLLRTILMDWGVYNRYSHSTGYLVCLDFFIFKKLKSWVFRNTPYRNKKKQFFFPENRNWLFHRHVSNTRWVLFCFRKQKRKTSIENFLLKLAWISSIKHKKVTTQNNFFDGNLSYWKFRFLPRIGEF